MIDGVRAMIEAEKALKKSEKSHENRNGTNTGSRKNYPQGS